MKLVKNIALTSAIAASAVFATHANAALITDWNFDLISGWTASTPASVTESGNVDINGEAGFQTLQWGTDARNGEDGWDVADVAGGAETENIGISTGTTDDQSALFIQNPTIEGSALTLSDDGGGVFSGDAFGTRFYHLNNVLSAGGDPALQTAALTDFFKLTGGGVEITTNPTFDVLFEETPNNGNCTPSSVSNCDDIFVLTNPDLLQEQFMHEGYIYTLTIGADGLGALDDATCAAAGVASGCVGLTTKETFYNPVQFFINLTARIPTPTSLALLGAGLLGLGAFARKQRKAS